MSGVQVAEKPRHPQDKNLSEALAEDKDRIKARKGLIDKTATLIKAPDEESDAFGDLGGTMRPTDEQLAKINGFTRKTVTADEVVAFSTLSCNDIVDRDDDQFTTQCVKDFAALEQPFSPVGKSFMLDHAYRTENAVGRIFGVDTKKVSEALFLTNEVYMPKTEQFAPLIEKIDFGISWAVSVGVMLGKDACSLPWCKAGFSSWGYWCQNGHDKGAYYVEDGGEDNWGYPLPVSAKTAGAQRCVRQFSEPRDMYELSQVFLGAQYFAALDKEPAYASVMKSVAESKLPIIGLSKTEAEDIPFRHEPKQVSEARRAGLLREDAEDGSLIWTDADGLRWNYDPARPEEGVLSLGKEATQEEDDGEHEVPGGAGGSQRDAGDEADAPVADPEAGDGRSGDEGDPGAAPVVQQGSEPGTPVVAGEGDDDEETPDDPADPDDATDPEDDDTEVESEGSDDEEKTVRLALQAGFSQETINAAKALKGSLWRNLLVAASAEIATLTPKAALGDQLLRELRADAIDWYTKARATRDEPKVKVETFQKVLDKCGDDVDLLRYHIEEQKTLAQAKFPEAVRRSSFPIDPNEATQPKAVDFGDEKISEGGDDNDTRVKRIHG